MEARTAIVVTQTEVSKWKDILGVIIFENCNKAFAWLDLDYRHRVIVVWKSEALGPFGHIPSGQSSICIINIAQNVFIKFIKIHIVMCYVYSPFAHTTSLHYSFNYIYLGLLLRTDICLRIQSPSSPSQWIYFPISLYNKRTCLTLLFCKGMLGTCSKCAGNTFFLIWQVTLSTLPHLDQHLPLY